MSSISGISTGYLPALSTPKKANNAAAVNSTPFGDLLSKQGVAIGNNSATALNKLSPADAAAPSSPAAEFEKYMAMSPAEKIRYNMLQGMGLNEDQLKALPPEERDKIELAIANRIKEQLQDNATTADAGNSASQQNPGPAGLFQAVQANNDDKRLLDVYS